MLADGVCQLTAPVIPATPTIIFAYSRGLSNEREGHGKYATTSFRAADADGALAAAYYRLDNEGVVLIHTEVPSEFSGQGIASQLAHGTFVLLRKTSRKAIPKCPFMGQFLIKNPQYSDVLAG